MKTFTIPNLKKIFGSRVHLQGDDFFPEESVWGSIMVSTILLDRSFKIIVAVSMCMVSDVMIKQMNHTILRSILVLRQN